MAVTETPEERAKRLGLSTGEPAAGRAKRLGLSDDDTVEVEAGYPERLATTVLKGAQVIPGVKSLEALAGSLGSKFTDTPVGYSDARAGLEEQTDRMGKPRGMLAQAAMSPALAPILAARGISALSPAAQGAAYGAASEAADFDPNENNTSRAVRTGVGGIIGGALGGVASGVTKLAKAPPGTVKGVLTEALVPNKLKGAAAKWHAATEPRIPVRPAVRLNEASAPKAEGFLGNGMDNVLEVAKAREAAAAEPLIRPNMSIDEKLRSLLARSAETFPRGEAMGNQFTDAEVAMGLVPDENAMTMEQMLEESLKHVKKGGTLNSVKSATPTYAGRPVRVP